MPRLTARELATFDALTDEDGDRVEAVTTFMVAMQRAKLAQEDKQRKLRALRERARRK